MPHANIYALGAGYQFKKTQNILKIIQRLPHAHQHHMGDAHTLFPLGRLNLSQHFRGGQMAGKAALPLSLIHIYTSSSSPSVSRMTATSSWLRMNSRVFSVPHTNRVVDKKSARVPSSQMTPTETMSLWAG